MIYTTLNRIHALHPSPASWRKLLKSLNKTSVDDEPLAFLEILKSSGIDDALWCTQAEPQHDSQWRLYAVAQVRKVQHLLKDRESIEALGVAERFAKGEASEEELRAAREAAYADLSSAHGASRSASLAAFEAAYDEAPCAYSAYHATACAVVAAAHAAADAATDAAYNLDYDPHYDADYSVISNAAAKAATEAARASQAADLEALLQKWEAAPGEAAVEILQTEA